MLEIHSLRSITFLAFVLVAIFGLLCIYFSIYSKRQLKRMEDRAELFRSMESKILLRTDPVSSTYDGPGPEDPLTEENIKASSFYKKNFKWITVVDSNGEPLIGKDFVEVFKQYEEQIRKQNYTELDEFMFQVKFRIPEESVVEFEDLYRVRANVHGEPIRVILMGKDGQVAAIGKYFPRTGMFQHHDPKEANKRGSWILYNTIIHNVELSSRVWLAITLGRPY